VCAELGKQAAAAGPVEHAATATESARTRTQFAH
jgi:hypothetical protein